MADVRCFLIEPTHMAMVTLRRFTFSSDAQCPSHAGGHDATSGLIEIIDATFSRHIEGQGYVDAMTGVLPDLTSGDWLHVSQDYYPAVAHDDPRWPAECECGYEFAAGDEWKVMFALLYRRNDIVPDMDTPDLMTLDQAPAGAMWLGWWMGEAWRPQLGAHPLVVKLPNGHNWMPDTMASNCGRQNPTKLSDGRVVGDGTDPDYKHHHCWVLHGTPPVVTADKTGETCNAGAGSIMSHEGQPTQWHGFLRNGYLTQ